VGNANIEGLDGLTGQRASVLVDDRTRDLHSQLLK
jgi:hypothetical protein